MCQVEPRGRRVAQASPSCSGAAPASSSSNGRYRQQQTWRRSRSRGQPLRDRRRTSGYRRAVVCVSDVIVQFRHPGQLAKRPTSWNAARRHAQEVLPRPIWRRDRKWRQSFIDDWWRQSTKYKERWDENEYCL